MVGVGVSIVAAAVISSELVTLIGKNCFSSFRGCIVGVGTSCSDPILSDPTPCARDVAKTIVKACFGDGADFLRLGVCGGS